MRGRLLLSLAVVLMFLGAIGWVAGFAEWFGLDSAPADRVSDLGGSLLSAAVVALAAYGLERAAAERSVKAQHHREQRRRREALIQQLGQQQDLNGVALPGADLGGLVLLERGLRNAVLIDANLRDAVLASVTLTGAMLQRADLRGSIVSGSLIGAQLQGADLRGADLRYSTLDDAVFEGARSDVQTRWPPSTTPEGLRYD